MGLFNAIGGLIGGGLGFLGGNKQADAIRDASRQSAETARLGFDFLQDSPLATSFLPGGAEAFDTQQALLGLGGDEQEANDAFQRFLDSSGFQFQLDTGRDAITGSRAARGILDNPRTALELQEFGQNLGQQSFGGFLDRLTNQANFGLQSGTAIGSTGSAAGATAANITNQGGQAAAGARFGGLSDLAGGFGTALGGFEDFLRRRGKG